MKTETIRTITIEDFKHDPHLIDYVDENLIVLDSAEATLPDSAPVKLDCFIIAFCMEGETSININNKMLIMDQQIQMIQLMQITQKRTNNLKVRVFSCL